MEKGILLQFTILNEKISCSRFFPESVMGSLIDSHDEEQFFNEPYVLIGKRLLGSGYAQLT